MGNTLKTLVLAMLCLGLRVEAQPWIATAGDSIMEGYPNHLTWVCSGSDSGTENCDLPFMVSTNVYGGIKHTNFGCQSQTWNYGNVTVLPYIVALKPKWSYWHFGVNDAALGWSWADVLTNIVHIKAQLDTFGGLMIVDDIFPDSNASDALALQIRQWNTNYDVWAATNGVVRTHTHDAMGQNRVSTGFKDDLLTAFDSGDHIHINSLGYSNWLPYISAAVSNLNLSAWFVDNSLATANGGQTWSNAWTSLGAIDWTQVRPGDTINVSGGTTSQSYPETFTIGKSGTAGNPITVSFGPDGASHTGTVVLQEASTRYTGILVGPYNWITINGNYGSAITGNTSYGLRIENVNATGAQDGVAVKSTDGPHDITVAHVEIYGTNNVSFNTTTNDTTGGIMFNSGCSNMVFGWNWVHGPYYAGNDTKKYGATGIQCWAGYIGPSNYTSIQIFSNKVENLWHDGIRSSYNASLFNNDVRFCNGSGHSDSLLIQSASFAKLYNNFVLSSDQLIYLDNLNAYAMSNVWVFNNVLYGSNCAAVVNIDPEVGSWDTFYFLNNTVVGSSGAYCFRGNGRGANAVTNLRLENNLWINGSGELAVSFSADNTFEDASALDYNLYQLASGNIAKWTDGAAKNLAQLQALNPAREAHGAYGSPAFGNPSAFDYRLSSGDTMAIGKGVNLSAFFSTDKDGNTRTVPWDIGAYLGPSPAPPASGGTATVGTMRAQNTFVGH